MKDTYYFSHDYNARNDPKMIRLFIMLGHEGKSVYWDLIELSYEQGGYLKFSEIDLYAYNLHTSVNLIKALVYNTELFAYNELNFWSPSVIERLNLRKLKREKASENAKINVSKRWDKTLRASLDDIFSPVLDLEGVSNISQQMANIDHQNTTRIKNDTTRIKNDTDSKENDTNSKENHTKGKERKEKERKERKEKEEEEKEEEKKLTKKEEDKEEEEKGNKEKKEEDNVFSSNIKKYSSKIHPTSEKKIFSLVGFFPENNSENSEEFATDKISLFQNFQNKVVELEINHNIKNFDIGIKYAEYFYGTLDNTERITGKDILQWIDIYDKLVRIDKREEQDIYAVTEWARNDYFWHKNFMSPTKLRRRNTDGVFYFDVFMANIKGKNRKNGKSYEGETKLPDWLSREEGFGNDIEDNVF